MRCIWGYAPCQAHDTLKLMERTIQGGLGYDKVLSLQVAQNIQVKRRVFSRVRDFQNQVLIETLWKWKRAVYTPIP